MSFSFPMTESVKYYSIFMACLVVMLFIGVGRVIYLDRHRILVQKDRKYMSYFFKERRRDAIVLFSMAAIYYAMFWGLFTYASITYRK